MDRRTDATTPATGPRTRPCTNVIPFEPVTPIGWLDDDESDDADSAPQSRTA